MRSILAGQNVLFILFYFIKFGKYIKLGAPKESIYGWKL